jgi:putative membrane protein
MATAQASQPVKDHPLVVTAVLSLVGYVLVLGTFAGIVDVFPEISDRTVILLSDAIALVNSAALLSLLVGWRYIRRGAVRKHRAAMLTAFGLISLFLVLYLTKVGGGFEKAIVVESGQFLGAYAGPVRIAYLAMLAVHILLSVLAVPVVLYPVVLGLTHSPSELTETAHAQVGRIAVLSWSLSLFLGIVTYFMLNHVYGWVPRGEAAGALVVLLAIPAGRLSSAGPSPSEREEEG